MNVAVPPRRRGAELLLAHICPPPRLPVAERLRPELGGELTELLVAALVRAQRDDRRSHGGNGRFPP
jgi:hypothetical protein